jgi:hypothetical protein
MAFNPDTNMPLAQHTLPETTSRLEITLRSKSKSTRQSEGALASRSRLSGGRSGEQRGDGEVGPGSRQSQHSGSSSVGAQQAQRPKGRPPNRPSDEEAGGTNGKPPGTNTKARTVSRRRAFISDHSEEEERDQESHQVSQPPPHLKGKALTFHDSDIDMQLEDVSPEHGGSSLKLSLSNEDFTAAPNQAAALRIDTINLAERTPPHASYSSPRKVTTSDTHSAKRRRGESGGLATITDAHKYKGKKNKEAIPSIDIVSHMWLGFPIHEAIAIRNGMEIIQERRTQEEFVQLGTPPREIIEFKTLRRAFPRVPQTCYPHERPDAVPGNHLHFTQLPRQEKVDPTNGLSEGFQVTIRFDSGYKSMSRQAIRGACLERLRLMDISLGTTYSNPIDVGINAVTKNWAGFIKVHLLNPLQDGMALLKGHRAFVLEMEDGVKTIGKVEKGFELVTKARNLRIHLKGETLRHECASTIFDSLVRESYYNGLQHEFMGLTKPELEKNFAFLTLVTEEARDIILNEGLTYNSEKLIVSLPRDRNVGNPSELRISTTLVANNLPQRESQATIIKAMKQLFGENNIVGIGFGNTNTTRQAGWCHLQCLNTAVYTEWIHKSAYILGRRIDFIPHRGSIDGSDPNKTAIRLAQAPVREVIADKVQAMGNATNTNPLITEKYLSKTMKAFEDKLEEKFGSLTTNINHHTDRRHEATTTTITNHTTNLHALLGTIAQEFQQSNLRMQGIIQGLSNAAPDNMHRTAPTPTPQGPPMTAPPLPIQAPPGFQNHPQIYQQGSHPLNG